MITLFTIPKPFTDPHIRLIQRNALLSWKKLDPTIDIILIGDDAGVKEMAEECGFKHVSGVRTTESGTPFLDSAFSLASKNARYDILMYSNADMIYFPDLLEAVKKISLKNKFLGVGRRIDLDITDAVDFNKFDWDKNLLNKAHSEGKLHSSAGMDYFIFKKGNLDKMPSLIVGRIGWDNWMILNAKKNRIDVIDMTHDVTALHENHHYSGINSIEKRKTNPEALANISHLGKGNNTYTTDDAHLRLENGILKKNHLHWLPRVRRFLR